MNSTNNDLQFENYIRSSGFTDVYQNLQVDSCTDDEFNLKYSNMPSEKIEVSVFHLNIRSLNANNSKLVQYLSMLNFSFDVLILSECWSYNIQYYSNIFFQITASFTNFQRLHQ